MATEGKETAYQEGDLQLHRIHEIQIQLNHLNLNLAGFNEELGRYNYLIKFDCLNTLFSEVSSSCNEGDKKLARKFITCTDAFLDQKIPHREKSILIGYGTIGKRIVLHSHDFDTLKKLLFEYEVFIKSLLHKYFRRNLDEEDKPKEW